MKKTSLFALVIAAFALLSGCTEEKGDAPSVGRFAAVSKKESSKASDAAKRKLCDATYPATGEGAKAYPAPPLKAVPGHDKPKAKPSSGWRWVNLWATWCGPCVEELPLIDKWKGALAKDGVDVDVELLSVDEAEEDLTGWLSKKSMPGNVTWLRSQEDLGPTLESFGLEKTSAIPIHLFVDDTDHIRCIRVGSLHGPDYGAVRTILKGS